MNTFLIFTAPPGFFTGGMSHDTTDSEEDLIVEYLGGDDSLYSSEYKGSSVYSDEEYTDKYRGGKQSDFDTPDNEESGPNDLEDIFGGQQLYVDSINTSETTLNTLIREDYQPEGLEVFDGLFEGAGVVMKPEDFDGIFDV